MCLTFRPPVPRFGLRTQISSEECSHQSGTLSASNGRAFFWSLSHERQVSLKLTPATCGQWYTPPCSANAAQPLKGRKEGREGMKVA